MANKELGMKLKLLRQNCGLTQKNVYEQLNVSQSTFSSWEIGKSEPDVITFLKLCEIYNVQDILFEFTGHSISSNSTKNAFSTLYHQLDIEDKAEIRGEIKQMLKAEKYNCTTEKSNLPAYAISASNFTNQPPVTIEDDLIKTFKRDMKRGIGIKSKV